MKIYSTILQGSEAVQENALDFAKHFDFSEDETQEHAYQYQHHSFIDTVNEINVYYNSTADYYFFTKY
jgi:hypothetical protein